MSAAAIAPPHIEGLEYVQPLGSGGYSEVFLYAQLRPRMNVAVKVLTGAAITDAMRRQFTAEGDAMAALADHPYIVQVFRADITADGRPYLVMKYYPQPNLGRRARRERLSVSEALRIGIQISSAVETAHHVGILHRDIKPANILTGQYGNPGLTDFGIAATTTEAAGTDGLSVPWSPPEVLFSSSAPDVRSDVYSLAATVWNLLAGRSPFEEPSGENTSVALMRRILEQPPRPTGRADVPESLDRLLIQAMAKSPAQRPQSALAFARGLQRIEQQQRLPLTQIIVPLDAAPWSPRRTGDPDTDATRIRTPTRVAAQLPADAVARPRGAVAPGGEPVARTWNAQLLPPDAPSRPTAPLAGTPPPGWSGSPLSQLPPRAPVRRPSRRPFVVAGLGLLAAAAIVIGLVLGRGGSSDPPPPTPSGTDQIAVPTGPATAPGRPRVVAAKVGVDRVRFRWTYDAPLATDSFLWRPAGSEAGQALTRPELVLSLGSAPVCIQVRVYRQDGSVPSPWSATACST